MSRAVQTVLQSLVKRLHPGFALAKRGGLIDAVLEGVAAPIAIVEREAEEMMDEIDPRLAVRFLPDFERVLGPDPCGRDLDPLSLDERQRIAYQRWTAAGGQSLPYLISVAAKLGMRIEIEEYWPSVAGGLEAGEELVGDGEQFVWLVKLAQTETILFEAGAAEAGDPLGRLILSGIECELRRIAHSHTVPVFSYTLEEAA
ncbi:DUF2313 domain-containing protein [Fulvimarina endophytica]|uniref:DUF2313 domain-containing protein n=1 Tax=Fulvimarina endophytica TaxID=2293836 RepID=A0A371X3J4_9HYPH|nr:putative phage tail protein [Fulvimarina endophytica]RFC63594.1 DUF2313 domain-containing protein [Fulvimarina endophytica]